MRDFRPSEASPALPASWPDPPTRSLYVAVPSTTRDLRPARTCAEPKDRRCFAITSSGVRSPALSGTGAANRKEIKTPNVAGGAADNSMPPLADLCRAIYLQVLGLLMKILGNQNSADHDVDQFPGHDDDLHHLLARHSRANFLVGQSALTHDTFGGVRRHDNAATQLAIDLHRNFDFFFLRQSRIVFRPRRSEQAGLLT